MIYTLDHRVGDCRGGESPGARVARQQAACSLRARLIASVPFSTRLAVRDAIEHARRYIFLRARTKDLGLRFSAHVREILHALAAKLVAAKQLTAPQDLFHLTRDEMLAVCRGEKTEERFRSCWNGIDASRLGAKRRRGGAYGLLRRDHRGRGSAARHHVWSRL